MRRAMDCMVIAMLVQLMTLRCMALHIVLHAQAHSSTDGYVIGSEMTCSGFERAFEAQGHIVQLMYPGNYSTIADHSWDIVFIEGWFPAITAFIHEIRRHTNGHAKVYFFCLDPDFPGLDVIQHLDVDAFFTNSYQVLDLLKSHAPQAEFMLLAANEPSLSSSSVYAQQQNPVVFVGNAVGIMTKRYLPDMLREAIPFGLTIYGYAWDMHEEFAPYWAGVLPHEDLFAAYSNAKVILGATMDGQRGYGMINNRVFEALAAGKILIMDHSEALETIFQDRILYYKNSGDVTRMLSHLEQNNYSFQYPPEELQTFISTQHTYHDRARQIIHLYNFGTIQKQRPNIPKILAIVDNDYLAKNILSSFFVYDVLLPAITMLRARYHVEFISMQSLPGLAFADHDLVLLITAWGSPLEKTFRTRVKANHSCGLFLLGPIAETQMEEYVEQGSFYDIIYYTTPRDHSQLSKVRTNVQHAFGWPSPQLKANNFSCDTIVLGDWDDDNQRLVQILQIFPQDKAPAVHLVLPIHHKITSGQTVSFLIKWGFNVTFAVPGQQTLIDLVHYHNCQSILLPSAHNSAGSDYILAAGVASGQIVNILDDNTRLVHLFRDLAAGKHDWHIGHVASMLELGKCRPLCMGRGNASVTMVKPLEHAVPGQTINIFFKLHNFRIPYDGSVCIFLNGNAKGCVFHDDMFFRLELPLDMTNISIHLGLRSMLYADTFSSSNPVQLVWNRTSDQATCAPHLASHKYKHLVVTT